MSPQVAVVTVNWNGWRNTLDCLAALRRARDVSWRLIIVDNASTDGSAEKLSGLGDDVVLIRSDRNRGWTGGNNLGVEYALREGFEHVFLLNNDAFVEPDCLSVLLRTYQQRAVARPVLGGALRRANDNAMEFAGSGVDAPTGLPNWQSPNLRPDADGLIQTASVSGAALFAHRSLFETLGFFDDRFYLYYDEVDWCFRAVSAGHLNWIVPKAMVRHLGFASSGGEVSPLRTYFMFRNMLLFGEKHSTVQQRRTLAKRVYWELRHAAKGVEAGPWPFALLTSQDPLLEARRRGVLDYLTRRFGDCPAHIRTLNDLWRSAQPVEAETCHLRAAS